MPYQLCQVAPDIGTIYSYEVIILSCSNMISEVSTYLQLIIYIGDIDVKIKKGSNGKRITTTTRLTLA